MEKVIKGYKVFNPDWTCNPNGNLKQYTCPGKFEEDIIPKKCARGMHFCKKAADCFNYYDFDPKNKVAEVIAYGDIEEDGDKCCTNKLEIVREIPWNELLEIVNTGEGCTGIHNSGDRNSGNYNSGNRNSGNYNSGKRNSGDYNSGNRNSGNYNSGKRNSGGCNIGDCNVGSWNTGDCNIGDCNTGNRNVGNWNAGNWNVGDWNKCNFSNGCFNTASQKIYLFNKPSEWTYLDWLHSEARRLLNQIHSEIVEYILFADMTDGEKKAHPEAETTGGYLKKVDNSKNDITWWDNLNDEEKEIIKSIPNFDKDIFKEITGIDID